MHCDAILTPFLRQSITRFSSRSWKHRNIRIEFFQVFIKSVIMQPNVQMFQLWQRRSTFLNAPLCHPYSWSCQTRRGVSRPEPLDTDLVSSRVWKLPGRIESAADRGSPRYICKRIMWYSPMRLQILNKFVLTWVYPLGSKGAMRMPSTIVLKSAPAWRICWLCSINAL